MLEPGREPETWRESWGAIKTDVGRGLRALVSLLLVGLIGVIAYAVLTYSPSPERLTPEQRSENYACNVDPDTCYQEPGGFEDAPGFP